MNIARLLRRWWHRRRPAATPERMPVAHGVEVTPRLIQWIERQPIDRRSKDDIVRDILARDAYGRRKYGQPLMSEDGRDHVNDARQELLDALQYIEAARIQGADVGPLKLLSTAVERLLDAKPEGRK